MVIVELEGVVRRCCDFDYAGGTRFAVEATESYVNWFGNRREMTTVYRVRSLELRAGLLVGDRIRVRGRLAHLVWTDRGGIRHVAVEVSAEHVDVLIRGESV